MNAPHPAPTVRSAKVRRRLAVSACGVLAVVLILLGWLFLRDPSTRGAAGDQAPDVERAGSATLDRVVELSPDQCEAAEIQVVAADRRTLQPLRQLPARIGYNEDHYLPLTSPVRGIVRAVHVVPGQQVQKGDLLAVISSSEVGLARSEVLAKQQEFELATQGYQWEDEILKNLESLLTQLATRPSLDDVSQAFAGKLLGDHRSEVLTAYANLLLAESTATRTDPLAEQGVVSGQVVQQRRSAREVAAAEFASVCEQTKVSHIGDRSRALAELNDARRRLLVAQQHMSALCGTASSDCTFDENTLNELQLCAPIGGQVTRKNVVPASRIDVADVLLVIADTRKLWVAAQLREQDWETLNVAAGHEVQVQVPAVDDQSVVAKVRFVGAEVSDQSRALPLIAEFEASNELFKPGLFAWVSVPIGTPRDCLAVPASALQRHEDRAFVFVQDQPGRYCRRDVDVGLETPEWIEIRSGIEQGQLVVRQGTFCLKSELLLEGE